MMGSNSKVYNSYGSKKDFIYLLHSEVRLKELFTLWSQNILQTFFEAFKDNSMRGTCSMEQCQYN